VELYLAGLYTSNFDIEGRLFNRLTEAEKEHRKAVRYYLESYHYIHRQSFIDKIRKDKIQVFLDSGAFSAFTKGIEVDMPAYCRYIQENKDIILEIDGNVCASVLDSIGSAQGTYENQLAMERLGVRPLPCFHYGEDERYLEWYISHYDHITLGGMVPISTPQLKLWLDRIWEKYLTDGSGRARLKVHGFGLTTLSLMERYPWFSVDSSSWVQIAATGNILLPGYGVIAVSDNSPTLKQANRHLDNLPRIQTTAVEDLITTSGFEPDRLRKEYISRWVFNCNSFRTLNDVVNSKVSPFTADQPLLF